MIVPASRNLASAGLSVAVLLFATTGVHAQEHPERIQLRGGVFDQNTFVPVPGVLVEVPGVEAVATTDSLGNFLLDLPWGSGYHLSVKQLGYASTGVVVFASDFDRPVLILVAPDPVMLEGLTIVVDRFRSRRHSSPYSVRTIDSELLRRWGGRDMLTVLRAQIPFLRPCPNDPLAYCGRFRGSTVRVRVCLDEVPALGGIAQLAAYPPGVFHLIELYNGGTRLRAYTRRFVERLTKSRRRLLPLSLACG
ncbi:MAG: hypothetical protein BMS9Abin29_2441 [Gemmatimonadota bacterium]|nr:MAG: hypothetical protein BMS9Abin29_2441 [Gemmatimonadota bacterium]